MLNVKNESDHGIKSVLTTRESHRTEALNPLELQASEGSGASVEAENTTPAAGHYIEAAPGAATAGSPAGAAAAGPHAGKAAGSGTGSGDTCEEIAAIVGIIVSALLLTYGNVLMEALFQILGI